MTNSDFSDSIYSGFNPESYGFHGTYPMDRWQLAQTQYSRAYYMISGGTLAKTDERENKPLYPLEIDLWDFVSEIHATMLAGNGAKLPPQAQFVGTGGARTKTHAEEYAQAVSKAWAASNTSTLWTMFYNMQIYGGYGLIARINRDAAYPIRYDPVAPSIFYPVLDSQFEVIEFFIHKKITHSEARWRYGVTLDEANTPYYTEHWNPEEYTVKINDTIAHYKDGTPMRGKNIFGVAPAVYVPHVRKNTEWGTSQILRLEKPVTEFNARIADVSDAVRNTAKTEYWGFNISNPTTIRIGDVLVHSLGESHDTRLQPSIEKFDSPGIIKDGFEFVQWLWDIILVLSYVPPVALGQDEGSQRSGMTLRTRFWPLVSHSDVERLFINAALNNLAGITLSGLAALGALKGDGRDASVKQVWPDSLPEDRLELVNEMVQRKAQALISTPTAIRAFADVADVEEEIKAIRAEQEEAQKRTMEMAQQKAQLGADKKEAPKSDKKNTEGKND